MPQLSFAHFSDANGPLLSTEKDHAVLAWSPRGERLRRFVGHRASVLSLALHRTQDLVLSASEDGTAKLWTLDRLLEGCHRFGEGIRECALASTGVIGVRCAQSAFVLPAVQSSPIPVGFGMGVTCLRWSSDGQRLLTGDENGRLRLWSQDGQFLQQLDGPPGPVFDVDCSPDSNYVVSIGADASLRFWFPDGSSETLHHYRTPPTAVRFVDDGNALLLWGSEQGVELRELDGSVRSTLNTSSEPVSTCCFVPADRSVLAGTRDGGVFCWSLDTEDVRRVPIYQPVRTLSASASGRWAIAGSHNEAWLWCQGREHRPLPLRGHSGEVLAVASSHSGDWIATGDSHGIVYLWNTEGELGLKLEGHRAAVTSLLFGEGETLISASKDGTLRCYSLSDEALLVLATSKQ
ncbi:MAG: hypothetical protein RBU37_16125 [Myxococcota bacterium]|nr:hypothetical protein [Myxococcota bacterium]